MDSIEAGWHVYILECVADTGRVTIHVGIAKDAFRRLSDHRAGKVKATRGRSIIMLGHSSPMRHGDALAVEAMLKKEGPIFKRDFARRWRDAP